MKINFGLNFVTLNKNVILHFNAVVFNTEILPHEYFNVVSNTTIAAKVVGSKFSEIKFDFDRPNFS